MRAHRLVACLEARVFDNSERSKSPREVSSANQHLQFPNNNVNTTPFVRLTLPNLQLKAWLLIQYMEILFNILGNKKHPIGWFLLFLEFEVTAGEYVGFLLRMNGK
ncbi:hypothetical protein TWF481_010744 [Arthrobotrys musiformis]|uniref:Uncharacterized protein n=1 Tax=Arthrobotrys musiformis TaxID=47236 RepID=A0AAV9W2R0_9PEZI